MEKSLTISEIAHAGQIGYFIPKGHVVLNYKVVADYLEPGMVSVGSMDPKKNSYPGAFEKFWQAYHPERRLEKANTFRAWRDVLPSSHDDLVIAAKNYSMKATLGSGARFMKYPERFIKSELWESFVYVDDDTRILESLEYWDLLMKGVAGFYPAWTDDIKALAVADIRNMGSSKFNEKVWIFFSGRDPAIDEQKKKLGIQYKTFHSMLTRELLWTKVNREKPCPYCGTIRAHKKDCPIQAKLDDDRQQIMNEIEEGKNTDFSFVDAFKKEIGQ